MVTKRKKWEHRAIHDPSRIKNKNGTYSNVKTMQVDTDKGVAVIPSIRKKSGKLVEHSPKEAFKAAKKNKDAKHFKTRKAADKWDKDFHKTMGVAESFRREVTSPRKKRKI